MKLRTRTYLAVGFAVLLFCSCGQRVRVIPESVMSDIYAEMFLADQWVHQNSKFRKTADTTNFYLPIFEKYGYGLDDYRHSVEHYLRKPDDYARIVKIASSKLTAEAKRLQEIEDAIANMPKFSPYVPTEFRYDTLVFKDNTGLWPNDSSFVPAAAADSLADSADALQLDTLENIVLDSTQTKILKYDRQQVDSQKVFLIHGLDDSASGRHAIKRALPRRESREFSE